MPATDVDDLIAQLERFQKPQNKVDQMRVWRAIQSFSTTIEDEVTFQHRLLSSPLLLVIPRIASDLGVFDLLMKSKKPLSTDEIATSTKADAILLDRILRYLASQSMISSTSGQHWAPSTSTSFLANPAYAAGLRFGNLCVLPSCLSFPDLLSSNSYLDTTAMKTTACQRAQSTNKPMFEWLSSRSVDLEDFQAWMAETHKRDKSPFDLLPLEQLTQNSSPETAVFVDVGGGNGQSCVDFRKRLPNLQGRIINQDIQATASGLSLEGVDHQDHDFLDPQPVKGSRIYHVRKVLRILSDEKCVTLLQHLREAMSIDSVILVDDIAINPTELDWHACYVDLVMGMFFGMRERTLTEFENIFDKADLELRETKPYMEASGEHYMLLALKQR